VKRPVLLIVVVLAVGFVLPVALVSCGGGSGGGTQTTSTAPDPAAIKAEIKSAYETFFSSKTSDSDKAGLLQNGPQFQAVIKSFTSNPLAKNVSATVSSVTLQGPNKAKVVYVVKVGGAPLGKQTGSAVLQNGQWKVGDASLCKLIALGGTTPSVCKTS